MADKKLNPKPFFVLGVLLVIVVGGFVILGVGGEQQNYYEFASCLADEGATMYGFDACPHCNKQKNIIGREAFKQEIENQGFYVKCQPENEAEKQLGGNASKISSVESLSSTTTQSEACQINVGAGTPTWVIDGEKYVGEQTLADLSEATGCPLPDEYEEAEDVGGFTNSSEAAGGGQ